MRVGLLFRIVSEILMRGSIIGSGPIDPEGKDKVLKGR